MKSGIYKIINITNSKLYIGSTIDLKTRKRKHFESLKRNKHSNTHLQHSYNKHGSHCFKFVIIEYIDIHDELLRREQFWIDQYDFDTELYNLRPTAESMLGYTHSEETKQRISDSMKGDKCYCYGIPKSQEIKQKISESQKGERGWRFGKPNLDSAKQVAQVDKDTNEIIAIYESVREAERQTGLKRSGIYNVASKQIFTRKGKEYTYKTAHGYKWEYV